MFSRFIDDDGNIGSTDATSLLGLYNAAYLRTHGEKILDVAMSSTKKILKSIVNHLDPTIADEIRHRLETPLETLVLLTARSSPLTASHGGSPGGHRPPFELG